MGKGLCDYTYAALQRVSVLTDRGQCRRAMLRFVPNQALTKLVESVFQNIHGFNIRVLCVKIWIGVRQSVPLCPLLVYRYVREAMTGAMLSQRRLFSTLTFAPKLNTYR